MLQANKIVPLYMSKLPYGLLTLLLFSGCKTQQQKYKAALQQAQMQWACGQRELAQDSLEMLSQQNPNRPELFELLAQWEEEQGHCLEAALYLERAAQLDVNQPELRLRCASLYEAENHWEAALRNYQEFLRRFPKKGHVWCCVAQAHKRLDHTEQALQSFFKYMELTPQGQEPTWATQLEDIEALIAKLESPQSGLKHGLKEGDDTTLLRFLDALATQEHWTSLQAYLTALTQDPHSELIESAALARIQNALLVHEEAEAFKRKNRCVAHAKERRNKRPAPKLIAHNSPTRTQKPLLIIQLEDPSQKRLDYDTLMAYAPEPLKPTEQAPATTQPEPNPAPALAAQQSTILEAPTSPEATQAIGALQQQPSLSPDEALALKAAAETLQELGHTAQARCLYKLALRFLDTNGGPWCQAALALVALEHADL